MVAAEATPAAATMGKHATETAAVASGGPQVAGFVPTSVAAAKSMLITWSLLV